METSIFVSKELEGGVCLLIWRDSHGHSLIPRLDLPLCREALTLLSTKVSFTCNSSDWVSAAPLQAK